MYDIFIKLWMKPGGRAHTCDPSYLEGGDQEASPSKTFTRPHLDQWLDTVACICYPSYGGKFKTRDSRFRPAWAKT
jgi:hypothetical protein